MISMKKLLAIIVIVMFIFTATLPTVKLQSQKPIIIFDESHNQYYDSYKLSMFIDDLKKIYKVIINKEPINNETLQGASLLIITNPRKSFSDEEVAAIKSFIENGGALLIMGDWYKYISYRELNKITAEYGIEFTATEVMDKLMFDYRSYFPLIGVWSDDPQVQEIKNEVGTRKIKYNGCMLKLSGEAAPIIYSFKTSYVVDKNGNTIAKGSVPVAAYAKAGKGYIIVVGGSRIASTKYFYEKKNFGNKDFMLALVSWLIEHTGLRVVSLNVKASIKPSLVEVGEKVEVILTVTLENLGDTLTDVKITASSATYKETKTIESIARGKALNINFTFEYLTEQPGENPVLLNVSFAGQTVEKVLHIYSVKKGEAVIIDQSHGEYYNITRMQQLKQKLEQYGTVAVCTENLAEALKYAKILILPNPQTPLSSEELNALHSWLKQGGRLIITGNWYRYFDPSIHNSITSIYGITWMDGSVRDPEHSLEGRPYAVYAGNFAENKAAIKLTQNLKLFFFSGTSLQVSGEAVPIILGWPSTYVVNEKNKTIASGEDVVLAAFAKAEKGYILAIGSTVSLLDTYYGENIYENNLPLIINFVEYKEEAEKPKVYVPNLTVKVEAPAKLTEGEKAEVKITVSNIGNGTAADTSIKITAENLQVAQTSIEVGNIEPGKAVTKSIELLAPKPGQGKLHVEVTAFNWNKTATGEAQITIEAKPAPPPDYTLIAAVAVIILIAVAVAYKALTKKRKA